jgi:hypothetical protein
VRCDAEGLAEAADEMRRACPEELAGCRECHDLELVRVEELAQSFRELADATWITLVGPILEMHPQAFDHERKVGFSLECLVGMPESLVQTVQATT